jgi:hypothetical protein
MGFVHFGNDGSSKRLRIKFFFGMKVSNAMARQIKGIDAEMLCQLWDETLPDCACRTQAMHKDECGPCNIFGMKMGDDRHKSVALPMGEIVIER